MSTDLTFLTNEPGKTLRDRLDAGIEREKEKESLAYVFGIENN